MATCPNGHHNRRPGNFCTTCGSRLALANPWLAAPQAPQVHQQRHASPASPPSRRPSVALAVLGVLAVLVLVAVIAVVSLGGSDDVAEDADASAPDRAPAAGPPGPLVVMSSMWPSSSEQDLHLVRAGTDLRGSVPFAIEARSAVPIPTFPASAPGTGDDPSNRRAPAALLEVPGGAVVGWYSAEGLEVGTATEGNGLMRGAPRLSVRDGSIWVNLERTHVLVVEPVAAGVTACHAAPLGEEFIEIVRAQGCQFGPGGQVVSFDTTAGTERTDLQFDVQTFDVDGAELASFAITGNPSVNRSGTRMYAALPDRLENFDFRTGASLGSVEGPQIRVYGWMATGDLLYSRLVDGEVSVRLLTDGRRAGPKLDGVLASAGGVRVSPFGRRTHALIGTRDPDKTTLVVLDGVEGFVEEILSAPSLDYRVIDDPQNPDEPFLLAWSLDGDGRVWFGPLSGGALPEVGPLPATSVGPSITNVVFDPESQTAYASLRSDAGSSLVHIGGEVTTLISGGGAYSVLAATDSQIVVEAGTGTLTPTLISVGPDGEVNLGPSGRDVKLGVVGQTVTYWCLLAQDGLRTGDLRQVGVDGASPPAVLAQDVYVSQIGPGPHRLVTVVDAVTGGWVS